MKNKFLQNLYITFTIVFMNVNFMSAQMVGPNAYIKATSLEIGLDGQGGFEGCNITTSPPLPGMHFRSANPLFGFVANPQVNLWTTFDGDFFTPGTPENGWGIEIGTTGGVKGSNNATSLWEIPGAMTDWTHTLDCYSADWEGDLTSGTNLHFKINYFLQETDLFYTTTVYITNNTSATIPELFYYRNLDPDNNVEISFDYTTQNTIVDNPPSSLCNLAHVSATSLVPASQPQSYLGLAALGANYRVCYGGFSNRDGSDLWNGGATGSGTFTQTIGATNFADEGISLSYRIQNLAPGATEVIKFVVILDDASASQAINNLLYLSYPGSTTTLPQVCTPYIDTIPTCGGFVPISVNGVSVGDYSWAWSPSTGLSDSTGAVVIANPSTTTTYVVDGTPLNACVAPISFTFVVEVTPGAGAPPIINSVPPLCVSSSPITLTVDSTGGTWTGTGITSGSGGTFDPAASGVGTFMISYTTSGLCFATDTMLITVNTGPDPTITQPIPVCVGDPAFNLTSASTGGVWSGTGITSGASGTFNPATAGVGTHIITYSIAGTCSTMDTVTVTIVGSYDATISPAPTVCQGTPAFTLSAASSGGTWAGTGITSTTAGTYNPTTAGTFPITYTIPGACGTADTINITVIPQANANINPVTSVCSNAAPFNLTAAGTGGLWSGVGITDVFTGEFDPSTTGGGTFTITYTIGGTCGDSDTETVTVLAAPSPTFSSPDPSGCPTHCVSFFESSSICPNVLYDFGDGDSSAVSAPTHCYDTPGSYSVTLYCIAANGCVGTLTIPNMVTIFNIPVADFTISPSSPIAPNTAVTFTDITSGGTSSVWNFGDSGSGGSNTATGTTASHTYNNEGDYCITLTVANSGGCIDTARYCIIIVGEATIFIPNVFSPNGDGDNELFLVSSTNVKEIAYDIYDRWGLKIASYNGITGGWNGETKNGKMATDGVYYYVLKAITDRGETIQQEGFIHLFSER